MPSDGSPNVLPPISGQLKAWFAVGLQSFGGGMATLTLIRREFVEKRDWISEDDYVRLWAICQIAPGINLLSFAILIGKRLGGGRGAAVALIGMLLPSVIVTVSMTAAYASIRDSSTVRAALRAVVPATVGIGLATAIKMAIPILSSARSEGTSIVGASMLILAASAIAVSLFHSPVIFVLLAAGVAGGLSYCMIRRPAA